MKMGCCPHGKRNVGKPYWKYNVLRHNLDVMHIEKNVCDNIVGTLLNLERKSKDNDKARYDLIDINIRSQLHPRIHQSNGRKYLPRACYQMTSNEKKIFLGSSKEYEIF